MRDGNMIGVGIDTVDVARFRAVLDRRPHLAERVFTENERRDVASRTDPVPGLAARFAAKEAAMKALGVGIGAVDFNDLEVVRAGSGAPNLVVTGRAATRAEQLSVDGFFVSLTHTATVAQAVVLAEGSRTGTVAGW